ncbi:MAG: sortase [Ardenticatenales bacterium]|nr:sortase [Ardenticatenales bacterium]
MMKKLFALMSLLLMLLLPACGAAEGAAQVVPTPTAAVTSAATRTPTPPATSTKAASSTRVPPSPTLVPPSPTATSIPPTPAPTIPVGQPARLVITKIGVDAQIVHVGQDAQGRMNVPEEVEDIAWYMPGAKPGEAGSAVLSGHFDDYKQDPAVFWRLDELEEGDEILVTDDAGREHRFAVVGKEAYSYNEAPLERIFGFTIRHNLNLITCKGIWDASSQNYDQRLVIYTRLVEAGGP